MKGGSFVSAVKRDLLYVGSESLTIIAVEEEFQLAIVMPYALASAIVRSKQFCAVFRNGMRNRMSSSKSSLSLRRIANKAGHARNESGPSHAQNGNWRRANDCVAVDPQVTAIRVALGNQQIRLRLLHSLA